MEEPNQEKMQELYMELQMLNSHLKQLRQQQELLGQQTVEITQALQGLDEFKSSIGGSEMFVPLSSGIFVKAKVSDTGGVLMNVGAGVCVVKDIPSAKQLMQKQLDDSEKFSEKIAFQMERFSRKAANLQHDLQALLPSE